MRIVVDMQGAQTESRFRGIGRYSMSFSQAIVRNRGEHEVLLVLNGLFPETTAPIRAAFDGLLPQEQIRIWSAPGPVREENPNNDRRRKTAEIIREAFLTSLQPDIIHISSLFEGYVDDAVTTIGQFDQSTPVSVSLYDLIPLLNQEHYLQPNPGYEQYYLRKIEYIKQAAKYLSISEFTREEGLQHLKTSGDRIVNVSTATEPHFKPLHLEDAAVTQLCHKFGLRLPFILYTGGSDERKNLPRLIEAFATLPSSVRKSHQLVFAGKISLGNIALLQHKAKAAGLTSENVQYTGYITDEELILLYNLCKLFIFPSWHEGFGLPALEAMACGAPVIGANTSSLPEVIGLEEALFDPLDVTAITAKIAQALEDDAFRAQLREHGLQRAKLFSWDESANRAITAWEQLHTQRVEQAKTHKKAWADTSRCLTENYNQLIADLAKPLADPLVTDDDLRQVALCLGHNEQQTLTFLRSMPLPETLIWRIEGPFDSSYSLALVNRETARALAALGHRVILHSTEGPGDFTADPKFLSKNPDLAAMHLLSSTVSQVEADITSRNLYPPRVSDMCSRLNFLHAYGWEESGFPGEWVESFNSSLQGMTVMSEHVRKIMIDSGVTAPLAVCGIGVDHWERIAADENFLLKAKGFRFLHVSSCFPRKGADILLDAYGRAFSARDDVTLVIKTFPNPHNEIYRWLEEARTGNPDFPDVQILEGNYTDAQLKSLNEQCNVLVAPSRAEGFGLPMAEAMLSGLAVITTGWSGQIDFCSSATAWLVDYQFEYADTHFKVFDSVWAAPDVKHLALVMREVYETPQTEREARISAGRQLLLGRYRWSDVAERMVRAARAWTSGADSPSLRIGWVSTWNCRCGIATYSEHLVSNVPAQTVVFAAKTATQITMDENNVVRCWQAGDQDRLTHLRAEIAKSQIDTLVVQFNFGFFDLEKLGVFLCEQVDLGYLVVLMMHATLDPLHVPHKKLSVLAPALRRCHRVLVHAPSDLNRLKALGVVENVSMFPHGILDCPVAPSRDKKSSTFIIGSYGFFLPHKGLLELIEAVTVLRSQGMDVSLSMINAEYPVAESRVLIDQATEIIRASGMAPWIDLTTAYLDDQECLHRLSQTDLIVFPYQNTGESSSAAVRYGLATGRPVAVTPMPIFEDVKKLVYYLPGQSVKEIADGLTGLIKDLRLENSYDAEIEKSTEKWRTEHRYSRLGSRLYRTLVALRQTGNTALDRTCLEL